MSKCHKHPKMEEAVLVVANTSNCSKNQESSQKNFHWGFRKAF